MKKIIYPLLITSLICGFVSSNTNSYKVINAEDTVDEFYDCDFVMEESARLTADKDISYHGYLLRNSYEKIKKFYTNITFSTVVYPTYYVEQYGKVNEETLFGSSAIYTTDPTDTTKVLLPNIESEVTLTGHNVEVVGNYNIPLLGITDCEYTGLTLMSASLYGATVNRLATPNNNSISLISLAETSIDNYLLDADVLVAAKEIIDDYAQVTGDVVYYVEKYFDDILLVKDKKTAKYGSEVSVSGTVIDGYTFLPLTSTTKGIVRAKEKLVLKLYYVSNPKYKISYYLMDADANYVLCKEINDLSSKYYEIITLTEEQKKLPSDIVLPVPGYKDDYVYSTEDSVVSGVNDGSLELKVCYKVSSRIASYMQRKDGVYKLTKTRGNDVPYGYLMCGVFAKSAVFSVQVPTDLIKTGGGLPTGGITFTNGASLTAKEGFRNVGDWVAMDIGLHVKGLKTSNNIDNSMYARCAEVNDAAQCKELYYDKTDVTNPTYINDKARELTVALYNDAFYIYIDDVLVTRFLPDVNNHFFMPKDPTSKAARFHAGDSYMFGVFMGAGASTKVEINSVNELYGEDAVNEIKNNQRYKDIPTE